jgi:hypothetical protein
MDTFNAPEALLQSIEIVSRLLANQELANVLSRLRETQRPGHSTSADTRLPSNAGI